MDIEKNNTSNYFGKIITYFKKIYYSNINLDPVYLYTTFILSLMLFGFLIILYGLPIQFMFLVVVFILFISPFYSRRIYYSMIVFADILCFFIIYDSSRISIFTKQTFILNSVQTLVVLTIIVLIVSEIMHWAIPNLLKAEAALKISQENYKDLIDNANSIILTFDKKGNVSSMNKYGLEYFGYSEKDIIGKNIIGNIVPEFDTQGRSMGNIISEIFTTKKKFISSLNENIKKNGERVWIYWTDTTVKNLDGKVESVLSIGSDITELKMALNQIEKNIQYFATGIDQIRNPLAVITGIAELKIKDPNISKKLLKQIDCINEINCRLDEGWHESEEFKKFIQSREMISYLYTSEKDSSSH